MAFIEGITLFCIGASYAVALAMELAQLFWPRPVQRLLGTSFGIAGLLAHTLLLARTFLLGATPMSLASQSGSMLFLAWILAVFYLYGSIHHRRLAWGVFILPLVLGLVVLAGAFGPISQPGNASLNVEEEGVLGPWALDWGLIHGTLLLLAAVGVCVGFVASIMYLVQARRLKSKALPGHGIRLLSLERLEEMNRRGVILAFPLLTAGLLVGIALRVQQGNGLAEWGHLKILSTGVLWLVFAILLYLRYGIHVRGKRVALLTIVAFGLLLFTLASTHQFGSATRRLSCVNAWPSMPSSYRGPWRN
jgi:ABC-type transport system involved in cytochrome c biogenesis permease subunit